MAVRVFSFVPFPRRVQSSKPPQFRGPSVPQCQERSPPWDCGGHVPSSLVTRKVCRMRKKSIFESPFTHSRGPANGVLPLPPPRFLRVSTLLLVVQPMKKELAALLSRAEASQTETSQNAISRLLKLVSSEQVDAADAARQAFLGLLSSSRLAVVSSACRGTVGVLSSAGPEASSLLEAGPNRGVRMTVGTESNPAKNLNFATKIHTANEFRVCYAGCPNETPLYVFVQYTRLPVHMYTAAVVYRCLD